MPLPVKEVFLDRLSAKQMVYESIKDWIIERQLRPGEKISDNEIASYFKISRTPVREALQLLESQKLVKTYPGKGTYVTELEMDNIDKWYQPMAKLQQLAITQAAEKITRQDIAHLWEISNEFKEYVKEQSKPMYILKADKKFHSYILEVADNEYITDFCNVLWIHIQRLEYSFFRDTPLDASMEEHEQLIRALEMRDSYSVSVLMHNHWERTALVINELNKATETLL